MRKLMALMAFITFVLIGAVAPDTQVAQAGGGPTGVPWLRVYQVDPRAVEASTPGPAVAIVYDTAGLGNVESIYVCVKHDCINFVPGFHFGGYEWGNPQTGWSWLVLPASWLIMSPRGVLHTQAVMVSNGGRREIISSEPAALEPRLEASGEVWPFIDQAPTRLGETLKLRIERDLGLPIIQAEICFAGMVWTCQYENDRDWGFLLNGAGTQKLDLVLGHPNIVREGPRGKLLSFPNGASIRVRYTMVDGSSVTYQSEPLYFLP